MPRNPNQFDDFDYWKDFVRATIFGTVIANMAGERLRSGAGAPGPEEMAGFVEEAEGVCDLWEDSVNERSP